VAQTALAGGRRFPGALLATLATYLSLGVFYSLVNPVFEAPDEQWHFLFVRHVASGQGLPVQQADRQANVAGPEGGQPPIYYLLGGALTSWIEREDLGHFIESNPAGSRGYPSSLGNKNVWVQLRPDSFPWHGEYLAAHLLRFLSLLLGALTVVGTYATARELYPDSQAVAAGAAAVNAFVPQFLFITAAVNNDAAAAATGAWMLYLLARIARRGATPRRDVLLGGILGLAALSKLSLLAAIPFAIGTVSLVAVHAREAFGTLAIRLLRIGVPIAAIAGWWYVRNWRLYGDLLGFDSFLHAVGSGGQADVPLGGYLGDLPGLVASFWALFGWFSIVVDPAVYRFYDALSLAALAGLATYCSCCWRARHNLPALARTCLPLAWGFVVFASLVRYRTLVLAFQGRLLFPAIASIAILLALGLSALPVRRLRTLVLPGALVAMLAIAVVSPLRYIAPAYAPPALLTETELESVPRRVGAVYGDALEMVGYSPRLPRPDPDGKVHLDLYWRARSAVPDNYSVSVQLFDSQGRQLAQDDSYPGRGTLPTSRWRPGDAVRDVHALGPLTNAPEATTGAIVVSVYRPGSASLQARDPNGAALGVSPVVGRFKVGAPTVAEMPADGQAILGDQVALVGHSIGSRRVRAGEALRGELAWQALRQMDADYTVFVQLVGPGGLVAQYDSQPRSGSYPTSCWDPGEVVRDGFSVPVMQARPGEYRLIAGLYDLQTGKRLRGSSADYVDLGGVLVVE